MSVQQIQDDVALLKESSADMRRAVARIESRLDDEMRNSGTSAFDYLDICDREYKATGQVMHGGYEPASHDFSEVAEVDRIRVPEGMLRQAGYYTRTSWWKRLLGR